MSFIILVRKIWRIYMLMMKINLRNFLEEDRRLYITINKTKNQVSHGLLGKLVI